MREDVEGLVVRYAQCVGEGDVDVVSQRAENTLLSVEEGGAAALVRAFRDILCFCVLLGDGVQGGR